MVVIPSRMQVMFTRICLKPTYDGLYYWICLGLVNMLSSWWPAKYELGSG